LDPIDITIKNYRCFPDSNPVHLVLGPGCTAFVGPNNSGKSSLTRMPYELRSLFQLLSNPKPLGSLVANEGTETFGVQSDVNINEIFCADNEHPVEMSFRGRDDFGVADVTFTIPRNSNTVRLKSIRRNNEQIIAQHLLRPSVIQEVVNDVAVPKIDGVKIDLGFIQETARLLGASMYIGPFRHFSAAEEGGRNYFDLVRGRSVIQRWHGLSTSLDPLARRRASVVEEALGDIFGISNLLLRADESQNTFLVRGTGVDRRIDEMGSGIAEFVYLLTSLIAKDPSVVLIDEPELHLHPRLQLAFVEALRRTASFGVVFATHSLGLARQMAERTYVVTRGDGPSSSRVAEYTSSLRVNEALAELGFGVMRADGADGVLLVEGKNDVPVFRSLLRTWGLLGRFAVIAVGGQMLAGNVGEQLEETKRLATNIIAIVDSDRADAAATPKPTTVEFQRACTAKDVRCHILNRRAIENYFPESAIANGLGRPAPALGPFDHISTLRGAWGKADGARIAPHMTKADLADTDLGDFLDSL
jgi:hypothetical protein